MIDPSLASIIVNRYNYVRPLRRETIGPNERLLEATTTSKREEKRCRVVAWSSVDRISCGDEES
jgi:hypothetical protein